MLAVIDNENIIRQGDLDDAWEITTVWTYLRYNQVALLAHKKLIYIVVERSGQAITFLFSSLLADYINRTGFCPITEAYIISHFLFANKFTFNSDVGWVHTTSILYRLQRWIILVRPEDT